MQLPLSNETFYIIDFDRTLANTDKLFTLFERITHEQTTLHEGALTAAWKEAQQSGGLFDVIVYLEQTNQHSALGQLKSKFIEACLQQDFFEPGARELIQFLTDHSLPFGILTYGGETWQSLKLRAMNLEHMPHIITNIKAKGEIIASWKQPNGMFRVPLEMNKKGEVFKNILLVDDRLFSFEGLPEGAYGIHVLSKHPLPSLGSVPVRVTQAHGMIEAQALIKASISI